MSSRGNTKRRDSTTPEKYFSGDFHGLKFFDTFEDNTDVDKPIGCIPNISLIDSNTKAIFDFNHCKFNSGYDQTTVILDGLEVGDGVTLTDALHFDPSTEERSDLSGYYVITGIYENTLVLNVSSVTSVQDYDKTYRSELFLENFSSSFAPSGISTSSANLIKNFLTFNEDESFKPLGIRKDDKIKILNGSNIGKYLTIVGFSKDENDHELLEVTGGSLVEEDRFNQSTLFSLYRADTTETELDPTYVKPISSDKDYINVLQPNETSETNLFVFEPAYDSTQGAWVFYAKPKNQNSIKAYSAPSLLLQANVTYAFNLVSSSHEFGLSTTKDGVHGGGIELNDVVNFRNLVLFYPAYRQTIYYYHKQIRNAGGEIKVEGITDDTEIFFSENFTTSTKREIITSAFVNSLTQNISSSSAGNGISLSNLSTPSSNVNNGSSSSGY